MNANEISKRTFTWHDWLNALLALWVILSPFILGFNQNKTALWNNIAVGVVALLITLASARGGGGMVGWIVPLALWLFVSAFVFVQVVPIAAYVWNNWITAFVLIIGGLVGDGLRAIETATVPRQG
jgi:hypothetical protein